VADARGVAARWVAEHAAGRPGFQGALLHGSIHGMAPGAPWPSGSDVDVWLLAERADALPELGKRRYEGLLLDVGGGAADAFRDPGRVLADYRIAPSFAAEDPLLADPHGWLAPLCERVRRDFDRREWAALRCDDAVRNGRRYADSLAPDQPLAEQAVRCAFAAGAAPHVLLAAARRNPTVRKRYVAAGALLEEVGRPELHESLLALAGCAAMDAREALAHVDAMERCFDRAARVSDPDAPFASDIAAWTRPITIDGTRELCAAGRHREAVFWTLVTQGRCLGRLGAVGAPPASVERDFAALLDALGLASFEARAARCDAVRRFLPGLRESAEALLPDE